MQTSPEGTGQSLFGLHLRGGSVKRVRFERCRIYEWGAQDKGTGGGAALGATTSSGRLLHDVTFQSCLVENNANVPGVYVGGISTYTGSMRNINVFDCTFRNAINYADQNAVYILGDTALTGYDVHVDRNTFIIDQTIDVCIEINYASGWSTNNNIVTARGTADLTGILIRGNCYDGMIASNTIRNLGTGASANDAVALVNFNNGEVQNNITITGNTISDFGSSALNLSRWSQYLTVTGNTLVSKRKRTSALIKVASTHNSVISNNTLSGGFNAIIIGGGTNGTRRVDITGNNISDCGFSGYWVIDSPTASEDVQGLRVVGNSFGDQVAGTTGIINTPYAVNTGNVVSRNYFVSGTYINPSFISQLARWDRVPANNGIALNGQRYSFPQGSIDFASVQPGSSGSPAMFSIGANLDGSNPDVAFGDTVLVSASMDLTGVAVFGYVQAANKIRITVANVSTNAGLSIAAGTWYALVIKRT
ncbi:hypothetical protein [Xanthomonas citri]|uniref:hypothetical protein n=1 Tax=Xanthomonas citri TaxID=346 RepID=UPI002875EFDE|nr:hypothetical protein [Xanthomonas citri]MDS0830338.1 hypothetical protein [Xanthomonas citri pv. punicae]MDS0834135.1 hypothetical protein [Xanthomonas citri pv. punicae]